MKSFPSKLYRIFYLFKMIYLLHKGIAERRFIRETIIKWRFSIFYKSDAKRKLELLLKIFIFHIFKWKISFLEMKNQEMFLL